MHEFSAPKKCDCGVCVKCQRRARQRDWYWRPENHERKKRANRAYTQSYVGRQKSTDEFVEALVQYGRALAGVAAEVGVPIEEAKAFFPPFDVWFASFQKGRAPNLLEVPSQVKPRKKVRA